MMGTILNANSYLAIEVNMPFKKCIPFCVPILSTLIIIGVNFGKLFILSMPRLLICRRGMVIPTS